MSLYIRMQPQYKYKANFKQHAARIIYLHTDRSCPFYGPIYTCSSLIAWERANVVLILYLVSSPDARSFPSQGERKCGLGTRLSCTILYVLYALHSQFTQHTGIYHVEVYNTHTHTYYCTHFHSNRTLHKPELPDSTQIIQMSEKWYLEKLSKVS